MLDLDAPALLDRLDPDGVGAAVLDPLGYVRRTWGMAKRITLFRQPGSLFETAIGPLLENTYQGSPGILYLDGVRYFTAGLTSGGPDGPITDVFVLVVNAGDERLAKKQANKSYRMARTLKRLGKALTMNHTMNQICVAASHEIASSAELAAVFIWVNDPSNGTLRLAATVGCNRSGTMAFNVLSSKGTPGCLAEVVATTREEYFGANVNSNVMSSNLEAKFCYLKPGGISAHPLVISDRLLGVLEMVGREDDPHFEENVELFQTVAEHFALALNAASLFDELDKLASHDPLTGLANHRTMHEYLFARLNEAERTGQELGVLMIDVDHFRSFNEEEGHDVGDQVLREVADAIKECLRQYDVAARYGGEEFTVVMPGSGSPGTLTVAERIRAKVSGTPFVTRSGRERHVTVSIGCGIYPAAGQDPASLLKAADLALFEAKRAGRNCVRMYDGSLKVSGNNSSPEVSILQCLDSVQARLGLERVERLAPWIEHFASSLLLSVSQTRILRELVMVEDAYRAAIAAREEVALLSKPEMRLLGPGLAHLDERFDGKGPRGIAGKHIPLLARVITVLTVIDHGQGEVLLSDPGRFDPEVVSILADLGRAA